MIEMRACVRPWCEIARRHTSASTRASLRGGCAPTAPRRASRVNTRQAILTCSAQRAPIGLSRRAAVTLSSAALSAGLLASRAHAQPPEVLAQGTVVLPSGAEQGLPTDQAALYLTIREPLNRLLPGSSSPPLASLRVAASQLTFPYAFAITASDLYPEFQHQPAGWCAHRPQQAHMHSRRSGLHQAQAATVGAGTGLLRGEGCETG
jgi:hypothetical protein